MKYLVNPSTDPHFNMAFDEFCLEQLQADEPVFYLWQNRPAVIIGLNQSAFAEVNLPYLEKNGIALARRVTGGGAVYHDLQNLNYTITGRIRDLEHDYPEYAGTMVRALRKLGVPAELSGRNDILVDGRKCSGYAKRVSRERLMVHGTLMYDVDIDSLTQALAVPGSKLSAAGVASVRSRVANLKAYLPGCPDIRALQAALQAIMAGPDGEITLSPVQIAGIEARAAARFRTWDWIYGHSPAAAFAVRRKFPCGTVEARFSIRNGRLEHLRFGGDFMGNLPSSRLETALEECPFTKEALLETLRKEPVENCFDRLSPDDLAGLLLDAQEPDRT